MSATYSINRRENTNSDSIQIASNLTEKSYIDNTVEPNAYYLYSIEANKDGLKKTSAEVEVFTFSEYANSLFRFKSDIADTGINPKTFTNNGVALGASGAVFSGGQYITTAKSTDFQFGTGDFTIEFCITPTELTSRYTVLDMRDLFGVASNQRNYANCIALTSTGIEWTTGSVWRIGAHNFQAGVEYTCAITRASGILRMFVNGVKVSQYNDSTNIFKAAGVTIGASLDDKGYGIFFKGAIKNVRITKGLAKYIENYTVVYQDK